MHVVLDSNIVIGDFFFRSAAHRLFLRYFRNKRIAVYLPKVSILEIISKYRNELINDIGELKTSLSKMSRVINYQLSAINIDAETEIKAYEKFIKKIVNDYKLRQLDFPKISHREVVDYSLSKKKPFDTNDKGYKDFLILNSLIELASKVKEEIFLITTDQDFGNSGVFHKDVAEYLAAQKVPDSKIKLMSSIKSFNEMFLKNDILLGNAKNEFIKDLLKEEEHESDYLESISVPLELYLYASKPDMFHLNIPKEASIKIIQFHVLSESGKIKTITSIDKDEIIANCSKDVYSEIQYGVSINWFHLNEKKLMKVEFIKEQRGDKIYLTISGVSTINLEIISGFNGENITNIELTEIIPPYFY